MRQLGLLLSFIIGSFGLFAQELAFPGADGFGKLATGGKGGSLYHVTNLNDSGPGSLRDAVGTPKRTVVFDVGGVIRIASKLKVASFITIEGQSAPGEGITVYGNGTALTGSTDVIIRYIRFRGSANMGKGVCTLSADNASNIILDHVSIEWGRWDNLHIKDSKDITLQYCLIGEGINPQMFGALLENPTRLTIHHCLWLDNKSRNPKAKAGIEFVNNVIYNWGGNGLVGGHSQADHYQDIVNNYFIAGPNSTSSFINLFTQTDHVFQAGNKVDLTKNGRLDGRLVTAEEFLQKGASLEQKANNHSLTKIDTPEDAYQSVIREAGASLHRDKVDKRLIGYVRSLGKKGKIIKDEAEVGGL